ncbi:DUF962 domain-containing protein [Methylibium rhizosphaerae]|uniref:Mpo1 family 2-hydroxy fatty acid dioxygenase n=1 Tax=Methylibium rhizosphaerae TaxID=2570323 RepID=UPI00112631A6|nr:Mpo1-like protein [Methylibium rhizosphaerae]
MRTATDLLSQYAAYHRDRRNIATHFVGIPMIVFGLGVLLARPQFDLAGLAITPSWVVFVLGAVWYLTRGSLVLGLATCVVTGVLFMLAHQAAAGSTAAWLGWGVGAFFVGWVIQFVGHYYEGRKPAFVDDLVGLMVGPMFVVAEWLFAAGWNKPMLAEIERRAGPTILRDLAATMPGRLH